MGLQPCLVLEGVEDPEVGLVDPEGLPGDGARPGPGKVTPCLEEVAERLLLAGLRLKSGEDFWSRSSSHLRLSVASGFGAVVTNDARYASRELAFAP